MVTKSNKGSEAGATLVETALALPIFLAVVLIFIFFAVAQNARGSLTYAVTMVRHAYTRGQAELIGTDVIPSVQGWLAGSGGVWSNPPPDISALLATPAEAATAFGSSGLYNTDSQNWFGVDLTALPAPYIYSLIYVLESMRQSVGPTLRYPCDPLAAGGEGCLLCRNLHPMESSGPGPYPVFGAVGFDQTFVGISCSYRPSNVFLNPIVNLLRLIVGTAGVQVITINRTGAFNPD